MTAKRVVIALIILLLLGAYMAKRKEINKAVGGFILSARSEARMIGVNDKLKAVVRRALALSPFDFGVTQGKRTATEQKAMFDKGVSRLDGTHKISKHQTGRAIDFVAYDENGSVTWSFEYYEAIANAFKQAARELRTPIVWGGDWVTFKDGPHIQLGNMVA